MTLREPSGTQDILPEQVPSWLTVESGIRRVFGLFGYQELRTPLFEYTSLFNKSTGETTDIVEKEMFTFGTREDEEGDSLTLRPEITPAVARVLIQYELAKRKAFNKFFYLGPAFRKERPQKGRLRQFTQFGVEAFGSADPLVDVECILLFTRLMRELGVTQYQTQLNSIGCRACRGGYRDVLRRALQDDLPRYCPNCRRRFERNVFRILDCKGEECVALSSRLPPAMDHICDGCRGHFGSVREALQASGIPFVVNPRIVRGLDYYTKTVFEFSSSLLGAQNAIGAGGRYDDLVADLGGSAMGAVGFAGGLERILLVLEAEGRKGSVQGLDFFVVTIDEAQRLYSFQVLNSLRESGMAGDMDFEGRSVKAQMRTADKLAARWVMVIGKDEQAQNKVKIKEMSTGNEQMVSFSEAIERMKVRTS